MILYFYYTNSYSFFFLKAPLSSLIAKVTYLYYFLNYFYYSSISLYDTAFFFKKKIRIKI